MLFKFYQIWDAKCWYCPLELDIMDGNRFEMDYYNPYREIQKKKKPFWKDEDEDDNNNKILAQKVLDEYNKKFHDKIHLEKKNIYQRAFGGNNESNNNNIKNGEVIFNYGLTKRDVTPMLMKYPTHIELSNVLKRASDTIDTSAEYRKLSQSRFQGDYDSPSSPSSSSFTFPPPSQPLITESQKRLRETEEFYKDDDNDDDDDEPIPFQRLIKPNYNHNAPKYKPQIERSNTQFVFDDDDYTEVV
jgi:hypothetical protein